MDKCEHIFKQTAVSGSVTARADLIEYCTKCNIARALINKEDLKYLQNLRLSELKTRINHVLQEIEELVALAMKMQDELDSIDIE